MLVGDEEGRRGPRRFLDYYGDEGMQLALSRYGLYEALEGRGYRDFEYAMHVRDERHTLIVSASHDQLDTPARLVELVVRRDRLVPSGLPGLEGDYEVLTVDWLMMQDPLRNFVPEKPRLPGQEAPGLGMADFVLEMLYRIVERLDLDGLLTTGEHFHNAVMYRTELAFLDPVAGGRCIALEEALLEREKLSLAEASWAVEWGLVEVCDSDDPVWRRFDWTGEVQVRAWHRNLISYLRSAQRRRRQQTEAAKRSYRVDREALAARMQEL